MSKRKQPAYVPCAPQAITDMEKARKAIDVQLEGLKALCLADSGPHEELVDDLQAQVADQLDIMLDVERELRDEIETLTTERDDLKTALEEATTEQEALTVADLAEVQLMGFEPIPYATDNLIDAQIMEALGVLLDRGRPLELLELLEALADQQTTAYLSDIIKGQKMLA